MNKLNKSTAGAQPMSPEAFTSKIRNAVNASSHATEQN
jgi:hypothetical protein